MFLALSLVPYIYFAFMQLRQQSIRHEMKEKLEQSMLHSLKIHKDKVTWIKAGKEIWINDRMFDVKSTRLEGNFYIFDGLYDEEETALAKQVEKQHEKHKSNGSGLLVFMFHMMRTEMFKSLEVDLPLKQKTSAYPSIVSPIISQAIEVPTPPPLFLIRA